MALKERLEAVKERLGACGDTVPRDLADETLALAAELWLLTDRAVAALDNANCQLLTGNRASRRMAPGQEAEELRQAIERFIENIQPDPDHHDVIADLQRILDDVDARDSLAYLERQLSTDPETTAQRLIAELGREGATELCAQLLVRLKPEDAPAEADYATLLGLKPTAGFPDWDTWQAALDKHLATIPPEQHDMVRQEWSRWQRRHMAQKGK